MPRSAVPFFLAVLIVFIMGCSPLAPVNAVIAEDTYRLLANQPYGDNERQMLDVYLPVVGLDEAPVVVFFTAAVGAVVIAQIMPVLGKHWPRAASLLL
jgi:hypothetical protein